MFSFDAAFDLTVSEENPLSKLTQDYFVFIPAAFAIRVGSSKFLEILNEALQFSKADKLYGVKYAVKFANVVSPMDSMLLAVHNDYHAAFVDYMNSVAVSSEHELLALRWHFLEIADYPAVAAPNFMLPSLGYMNKYGEYGLKQCHGIAQLEQLSVNKDQRFVELMEILG